MTASDIRRVLVARRYRRNFCLPGYTPAGWFESDVWEVLKTSGLAVEYEIKVSRSDFLADREKAKDVTATIDGQRVRLAAARKHELLARGHPNGPSRFYFVTPPGLLAVADLPSWAGLIEVRPATVAATALHEYRVRPAPRLHRYPVRPDVQDHARGVTYWRYHELLRGRR